MSVNQIKGKFVKLSNNEALSSKNQAGDGNVDILKVDTSDEVILLKLPIVDDGVSPSSNVSTEAYVDQEIASVNDRIQDHVDGVAEKHSAADIEVSPSGDLSSTNIQSALEEIQNDASQGISDAATAQSAINSHIADSTDAHDASAISVSPTGNLGSTDVQAALQELQGDVDDINDTLSNLSAEASAITVVPAGNIGSTNVQAAIEELDSEKVAKAGDTMTGFLTLHADPTADMHASTKKYVDDEIGALSFEASAISVSPTGNLGSTDVQAALQELQGDVDGINTTIGNLSFEADAIAFTPAGDIGSTDVQAAIEELDSEKVAKAGDTMTGFLTLHANPTSDYHAATKKYVDAVAEGLHVHSPARLLADFDLDGSYNNGVDGVGAYLDVSGSPIAGIDGVSSFNVGDRIVVALQNGNVLDPENGIYFIADSADINGNGDIIKLTRTSDFNTPTEMAGGDFIFVQDGSQYADSGWVMTETVTSVGVTPVKFVQFSGAGAFSPGDALSLTGSEFDVLFDNSTVGINGFNQLEVKDLSISTFKLQDDSVTAAKIGMDVAGDGLIQGMMGELQVNVDSMSLEISMDALRIKDQGVTEFKLGDLSVSTFKLQDDSVTAAKLNMDVAGDGLIQGMMGELQVNTDNMSLEISMDTLRIKDQGVTEFKLGDLSVSTFKLQDDSVTAAKINMDVAGDGLIQGMMGELQVNVDSMSIEISMDTLRIKDQGVSEFKLGDLSVSTFKLQDDSVTAAKLNMDVAGDGLIQGMMGELQVNVGYGLEILSDAVKIKPEFTGTADISISSNGLSIVNRFNKEVYQISSTLEAGAYFDLAFEIEPNSMHAFVDRLAIHEGVDYDYTISTVGSVSRVTFINALVTTGQQQLTAGDTVFFSYQKKAN
jgi:predicted transcriptional regulator